MGAAEFYGDTEESGNRKNWNAGEWAIGELECRKNWNAGSPPS